MKNLKKSRPILKNKIYLFLTEFFADTIGTVFSEIYTVDVANNTNRELFASNNADMTERFAQGYASEDDEDLKRMMEIVEEGMVRYEPGRLVLTDDKAPVELLGMSAIDAIIRDEVDHYKKIYKEYGISALLEEL